MFAIDAEHSETVTVISDFTFRACCGIYKSAASLTVVAFRSAVYL